MELWEWGEEKQFVQVLFEKVEAAIRCHSPSPKMKCISGVEQFNQSKMYWGIDTIAHENDYEGWGYDHNRVILGDLQIWVALQEKSNKQNIYNRSLLITLCLVSFFMFHFSP